MGVAARAAAIVALVAGTAHAEPAVDWARGVIVADAVGTADRRAPSPAVARVGAETEADARAREALLARARALPRARGGTVGAAADADPAIAAALAAAVDARLLLRTDYLPDGSVRVERGLAIEAIRQAVDGARAIDPDWSGGAADAPAPAPIVIDARGSKLVAAIGVALSDGTTTVALPSVIVHGVPAGATAIKADKVAGGVVTVHGVALDRAVADGAMVVLVVREK